MYLYVCVCVHACVWGEGWDENKQAHGAMHRKSNDVFVMCLQTFATCVMDVLVRLVV